jgi:ABC transporter DrrB family efflux protein
MSAGLTHPSATPGVVAPRLTLRLAARDIAGVAKRNLLRILRTQQSLWLVALQPAILLFLFRYVVGGAIQVRGGYTEYVVPAMFLEAMLMAGMSTAIGIAEDLKSGITDRFRSLPMARSAVLAGRTLADLSRCAVALAVMIGLSVAVGFRFHASVPAILGGVALVILFGFAVSWVYSAIGLATRDPQSAASAAILPVFILFFVSNAFVPVATMPGWLQAFARDQPASVTISAVRALLEGGPAAHYAWGSLAWSVGMLLAFLAISLALYRRALS